MSESHIVLIEAEGQPSITIEVQGQPDIVFQHEGIQGRPGPAGQPGADIGGYDPGDLTILFDNRLV